MPGRIRGAEATRLFRSIMKRVYWDSGRGVPVFRESDCEGFCVRLRLTQPGDVRPGFERDVAVTREAVEYSLGREAARLLLPRRDDELILLNRVQAIDAADEVIVSGWTIGVRMYDPYRRRWVFKPDHVGALILYEAGVGPRGRAREPLRPGRVLGGGSIRFEEEPEPGLYAVVSDGRRLGVVKLLEGGAARVVRVLERLPRWVVDRWEPRGASLREAVEANREYLEELEAEAVSWLRSVLDRGLPMVAVSGGKDSAAAAAIAAEAGVRRGYFFDTGIEFPETIETARRVADATGIEFHEISAGDTFWRALEYFGPPARDYRWCCKVVKFGPLERGLRPLVGGARLLTITGQRGFESTQRAAAGRLARSATTGRHGDLVAAPIQHWTSLEVHLYIAWKGLPLNPLYRMGYERVGCYLCPASRLAEIDAVRGTHRRLWERWEQELRRFAKRAGLPRAWVDYGFWRWRFSYPAEVQALARRLGLDPRRLIERSMMLYATLSIEPGPDGTARVLHPRTRLERIRLEDYHRLLSATGLHSRARLEPSRVSIRDEALGVEARVYEDGHVEIVGEPRDPRRFGAFARRVLAPLYMIGACGGCGVCVASCPTGAMRAPHTLDPERCKSCGVCVNVCPAGGKLATHAVRLLEESVGRS